MEHEVARRALDNLRRLGEQCMKWANEKEYLERGYFNDSRYYVGFTQGVQCLLDYIDMERAVLGLEPLPEDFDNF